MEVRWASKPMGERCGKRDKDGGVPDNQLRRCGKKRLWDDQLGGAVNSEQTGNQPRIFITSRCNIIAPIMRCSSRPYLAFSGGRAASLSRVSTCYSAVVPPSSIPSIAFCLNSQKFLVEARPIAQSPHLTTYDNIGISISPLYEQREDGPSNVKNLTKDHSHTKGENPQYVLAALRPSRSP